MKKIIFIFLTIFLLISLTSASSFGYNNPTLPKINSPITSISGSMNITNYNNYTTSGNPFDQSLNKSDNVIFNSVNTTNLNVVYNKVVGASVSELAQYIEANYSANGDAGIGDGLFSEVIDSTSSSQPNYGITSLDFLATANGIGKISYVKGVSGEAKNIGSGNVTDVIGGVFAGNNYGTGKITNAKGFYVQALNLGGGTIANGYGIYIANVQGNNNWGIFQSGTSKNQFGGNVTAPILISSTNKFCNSSNCYSPEQFLNNTGNLTFNENYASGKYVQNNSGTAGYIPLWQNGNTINTSAIEQRELEIFMKKSQIRIKNPGYTGTNTGFSFFHNANGLNDFGVVFRNNDTNILSLSSDYVTYSSFASTLGDLRTGSSSHSQQLTIKNATGLVGIGTTNPDNLLSLLQVGGGVGNLLRLSNNGGGEKITMVTGNNSKGFQIDDTYWYDRVDLNVRTSGTGFDNNWSSAITILYNKNVGIGTTNPATKLDVDGTINSKNYSSEGRIGINATGTSCTITRITNGLVTGAVCA